MKSLSDPENAEDLTPGAFYKIVASDAALPSGWWNLVSFLRSYAPYGGSPDYERLVVQ